ncbi:fibroblast growth factor 1 [Gastrophryne carolinensis]
MAEGDITTFSAIMEMFNLPGNYKQARLLYCRNGGYFLRILPNGVVDGTRDKEDLNIRLQLKAESIGVVCIKNANSQSYLAMDESGLLYGSMTLNDECLFLETIEENNYNTYKSKKYADLNWFVGIKKNGTSKRGSRTHYGQNAILFLPLSVLND